jgi:formylglycine-generating enzyme required for sulfatase activity
MPSISDSLAEAVMKGLAREPAARTRSIEAFAASLNTAAQSGTQILGGRATGRFGDGQPELETREWSGLETRGDGTVVTTNPAGTRSAGADSPASAQLPLSSRVPSVADQIAAVNAQATVVSAAPVLSVKQEPASVSITSEPKRRSPVMLWGGIFALVVIAVIAYFVIGFGGSGFTLAVHGAPAGSEVFVNGTSRGRVAADGTLKVPGLAANTMTVSVVHDGYAAFNTNVEGRKGKEQPLEALLLPNELDYGGSPMVLIPAGDFLMGDDQHLDDEKPAHTVTRPAFYIDKYEVSNAQYKQFCDAEKGGRYPETAVEKDYLLNNPNLPAVGIPFEDAAAFAKWAGKRLATEEEWEKAASWDPKTGNKRQWPWGDKPGGASANLGRNQVPKLAGVGTYAGDVSALGVRDLAGNVSEWVDALYNAYDDNPTPTPKKDAEFGTKFRVTRGGSIRSDIDQARTTFRGFVPLEVPEENRKYMLVGVRCAVSADDPKIQAFLRSRIK